MKRILLYLAVSITMLTLLAQATSAAAPKNFILLIGDGMGPDQVQAASYYGVGDLFMESAPYQAVCTTYPYGGSITDSAASATAIATGHKVYKGVISEARPANAEYPVTGQAMETLLEYYKAEGKSTGLVTTTYITHATPAAFGAHEASRNSTSAIANDLINDSKPNVLFGGGGNGMSSNAAITAGYTVVTNEVQWDALDASTATMVSGQFGSGHMPYEYSSPGSYEGAGALPHLSEMTATALDILDNNPNGFFLMVEGGRIDHAGHSHLINENIAETLEFDKTIGDVLAWAAGRDDTLVLVTADHETGGLNVTADNGDGNLPDYTWSANGHTGVNVPVYAWGVNASLVSGVMDNTDFFEIGTIPEPSSIMMLCMAAAGLLGYGWRRRS